jgi:predicted Zn-dependent protease
MKRVAGAAMILALLAACPAFAREASDEAGLLADAARTENALRQSPVVERDAALNAYLRGVLCRVAGDQCGDLRLYIINQPDFGASTLPNGAIEIGAGLVWRAANEDQLAFILSREIAH